MLWVSKFVLCHKRNLILTKMAKRKAFLVNLKHQYRVSQWGKYDCTAYNKKMEIITSIKVSPISWTLIQGKWWKEKLFLKIQSINIMYPNVENMIAEPHQKEWRLLRVSKFPPFQEQTLITRKLVERKAFLGNPEHQYHVLQ